MIQNYRKLNEILASLPNKNLSKKDTILLNKSLKLSMTPLKREFKLGAIVTGNGRILGEGFNSAKTHPIQYRWNDKTDKLHAEVAAIINSGIRDFSKIKKPTIYVGRTSTINDNIVSTCSYPCINCLNLINFVGIRTIVCYNEENKPVKINL